MNRAVESVGLEDGAVLLGIDAVNGRIDVVDGSSFNKLPSLFDMIDDKD